MISCFRLIVTENRPPVISGGIGDGRFQLRYILYWQMNFPEMIIFFWEIISKCIWNQYKLFKKTCLTLAFLSQHFKKFIKSI